MDRIDKLDFNKKGINIYWFDKMGNQVHRKAFIDPDTMRKYIEQTPEDQTWKLVLECSTAGDVRFSAFGATAKAFGVSDRIEFHYQLAKGFEGKTKPKITDPWHIKKDYLGTIKGKRCDFLDFKGKKF